MIIWLAICPTPLAGFAIDKTQFNPPLLQQTIRQSELTFKQPYGKWLNATLPITAWTTVSRFEQEGVNLTYIVTGDISAMWFRDSYNQIEPYLKHMHSDPEVKQMVLGLIRYQARLLMLDPYPNAYYNQQRQFKPYSDRTQRLLFGAPVSLDQGLVHQRKFQIDSATFFIKLVNEFFLQYQDVSFVDSHLLRALRAVRQMIYQQMDDKRRQSEGLPLFYTFERAGFPDQLSEGKGAKGGVCGLVRSGFRPSDDPTRMPYNIPGNSLLSIQLRKLSLNLLSDLIGKALIHDLLEDFSQLAMRIESSLKLHSVAKVVKDGTQMMIYAQETDCNGGHILGDDPNLPSLMALPLYNYTMRFDPIWINTKNYLYSSENRFYYSATSDQIEGLGSTHTPPYFIWPIGIITRMLTSQDSFEIEHCLKMLVQQQDWLVHESFLVNQPATYTRQWFAWADSMFSGALLTLAQGSFSTLVLK